MIVFFWIMDHNIVIHTRNDDNNNDDDGDGHLFNVRKVFFLFCQTKQNFAAIFKYYIQILIY